MSVSLIFMFVFQVEVKSKKEVSLLDLDDCELITQHCSSSPYLPKTKWQKVTREERRVAPKIELIGE